MIWAILSEDLPSKLERTRIIFAITPIGSIEEKGGFLDTFCNQCNSIAPLVRVPEFE